VLSGLPVDRFTFRGFLPAAREARRKALANLAARDETLVFYEAPHRLRASLADMLGILGDRRAAAARELTKVHEEVVRGRLSELAARFEATKARGEITLMVEGAYRREDAAPTGCFDEALSEVRRLVSEGASLRDAARQVAASSGHPRRALYQAALSRPIEG
jgi:16S rRNA (cytidine1402-2'-O)-methyltransferase